MKLQRFVVAGGLLFAMAFAAGGLTLGATGAAAKSPNDSSVNQYITMSPATTDITINPGDSYEGKATLLNQGGDSFSAQLSVSSYQTKDLTYDPVFEPIKGAPDVTKWLKFTTDTDIKDMKPGSRTEIRYTLDVPENTPAGGYYAVLFGTSSPSKEAEAQGVAKRNRVGNILYITVRGDLKEAGNIEAEAVPAFSFGGKIDLRAILENTGSTHFRSHYKVAATSLFGGTAHSSDTPFYVLPHTKRAITSEWQASAPFGIYKVSRSATLPSGEVKLADTWVVVVSPLLLIGVGLLLVALVLLLMTKRKKGLRRR